MSSQICTLTERGQVSMPAALRRQMQLKAGQRLRWESISETEVRIVVEAGQPDPFEPDPQSWTGCFTQLR